ncbi:MAG TPA: hypothetical protein VMB79_08215 [Jatrophihabitans sp.]|nr:hypothetical protein [Jatrophihabitans sp.]
MSDQTAAEIQGISRRAMLKRGAVAGATIAWTVPVVSAISMTPAHAESPSAPARSSGSGGGVASTNTTQLSSGSSGLASTGSDVSLTAAAGVAAAVLGAGAIAASKYRGTRATDDAGE